MFGKKFVCAFLLLLVLQLASAEDYEGKKDHWLTRGWRNLVYFTKKGACNIYSFKYCKHFKGDQDEKNEFPQPPKPEYSTEEIYNKKPEYDVPPPVNDENPSYMDTGFGFNPQIKEDDQANKNTESGYNPQVNGENPPYMNTEYGYNPQPVDENPAVGFNDIF